MNDITAVVLTAGEKVFAFEGMECLVHSSVFTTPEELHEQRLLAISKVKTPYFTFIDDDDELPDGSADIYKRLVEEMKAKDVALGYTDYREHAFYGNSVKRPGPYKAVKHYINTQYLHHGVVLRTQDAIKVANRLPRGVYWTEYLLYAILARGGTVYIPESAYIWNLKTKGMHMHPQAGLSQQNSLKWYLKTFSINA